MQYPFILGESWYSLCIGSPTVKSGDVNVIGGSPISSVFDSSTLSHILL